MRSPPLLAYVLTLALPLTSALHDGGTCQPTAADPSTVNQVDATGVGGGLYYFEERDPLIAVAGLAPVPGSGAVLGGGTWWYEETNAVPGLQRGGCPGEGPLDCLADPQCLQHTLLGLPCFMPDEPVADEHCGHGGDGRVLNLIVPPQ